MTPWHQRIASLPPQIWLGSMLLALHAALAWDFDSAWSRAFLLAHIGLFLIWQPMWRGERTLSARHGWLIVLIGVALVGFTNWWLMAIWLAVLFSLIGGNVPGIRERRHRVASLLAAVYLLAMLLVWVVPKLFSAPDDGGPAIDVLVRYGLLFLPVLIILTRVERLVSDTPHAVDLFYSVMLFLLVSALVLGSFMIKELARTDYPMALAQTLFCIALLLIALSWLWNPHGGFSGIGQLLSRYLLSVGLPFERWMQSVANRAEHDGQPERFLVNSLHDMLELPWLSGVRWQTKTDSGEFGEPSKFDAELSYRELTLTFYTRWSLSPALLLHLKLLTRLLAHFYDAKRREQSQRQNAYTQAIHETGARLTHDVKNLLQSLTSLCAAAEASGPEQATELQALINRQLPQIAQRLHVTLDKLRAPGRHDAPASIAAGQWWEALNSRYARSDVVFATGPISPQARVPGELFDSVADNLIQNALNKGRGDTDFRVEVYFSCADTPCLRVTDVGGPVPVAVAQQLFDAPVPSQTGLGIGLYQSAKQAAQHGYRLALAINEPGRVRFELAQS
ncbi:MAG: sensor histidine kinase [Betaproteobacteria bacterium]|nr:sensor histidine kinase [Betaproteobacteria bacterium]